MAGSNNEETGPNETAASDSAAVSDTDYIVERVLAEEIALDGKPQYLVKWKGIELSGCSWVPVEHPQVLQKWNEELLAVARGQRQRFDITEYYAAFERCFNDSADPDDEEAGSGVEESHRDTVVAGIQEDSEAMDVDSPSEANVVQRTVSERQIVATPARQTTEQRGNITNAAQRDASQKKGIARPVQKARKVSTQQSSNLFVSQHDSSDSSSDVPLKRVRTSVGTKARKASPTKASTKDIRTKQVTTQESTPTKSDLAQAAKKLPTTQSGSPVASTPKVRPNSTATRKSIPSPRIKPPPTKRLSAPNVLGGNWNAEKPRKELRRVSEDIPIDAAEFTFRNLSTQNRYQKFGRNEPVPDINALAMFDPRTGKIEPPKTAQSQKIGPADIHSAYGRRSPPTASKPEIPSVPRSEASSRQAGPETKSPAPVAPRAESLSRSEISRADFGTARDQTCPQWLQGTCVKSVDKCEYSHYRIPRKIKSSLLTCYFFKNGGCNKTDTECEYAHWDTGICAEDPRTARANSRMSQGPHTDDMYDSFRPSIAQNSARHSEAGKHALGQASNKESQYRPYSLEPLTANANSWTPKHGTTCYYWSRGHCTKSDEECRFAHRDTGVYAGEPGTYLESQRKSLSYQGAVRSELDPRRAMSESHPPNHVSFDPPSLVNPQRSNLFTSPLHIPPELRERFEQATVIADIPLTASPIVYSTDQMAPQSVSPSHTNVISPAKDPRRLPRNQQTAPSSRETPMKHGSYSESSLRHEIEMARSGVAKIDFSSLFRKEGEKRNGVKYVFIHMDDERGDETSIIREHLENPEFRNTFGCKVVNKPFEWDDFRKLFGKSEEGSLLIVHPSDMFYKRIPKLQSLISDSHVRICSIGVQHELSIRQRRAPEYEAVRLFPHGGMTFISDDVFVYYPEQATEIINLFLEQTKVKPPGAETYKIGARPGIKDWMLKFAKEKYNEQSDQGKDIDMRWVECYHALCRLCPPQDEDSTYEHHHVPLETSLLWSVWEDSMPNLKGLWESGDEGGATEYMAMHFAGEARSKAWKYRRFNFVYQRPEDVQEAVDSPAQSGAQTPTKAMRWMDKYNHVAVRTPDWVIKMMKKRGKTS